MCTIKEGLKAALEFDFGSHLASRHGSAVKSEKKHRYNFSRGSETFNNVFTYSILHEKVNVGSRGNRVKVGSLWTVEQCILRLGP